MLFRSAPARTRRWGTLSSAPPIVRRIRRRPTLPGGSPPSTIGAGGLHFRVRDGNGCFPAAIATGNQLSIECAARMARRPLEDSIASTNTEKISSPRPISTGRLNTSPCVHLRPINLVVYQGPYPVNPVGELVSRRVSRLDRKSTRLNSSHT